VDEIDLQWTAPADPPTNGPATSYDMRQSLTLFTGTDPNWYASQPVSGVPSPATPGTVQSVRVHGLYSRTQYYFAIRSADALGHVSVLSNITGGMTLGLGNAAGASVAAEVNFS